MTAAGKVLLKKLLFSGTDRWRRAGAWAALFVGTLFLLVALSLWWNFRLVLRGSTGADALGSGFFAVSRPITDADMGRPETARFTDADIAALGEAPEVEEVGRITQAAFPVSASLGGELGFSTLLFLEAVPDAMLDTLPQDWNWTSGRPDVPIILAKEFLRTYNYVFAPTQGLPQVSENAVKALGFDLQLGAGMQSLSLRGQVVGFSDRITSVLVPQAFLDAMHQRFRVVPPAPARLLVRARDPAAPKLVQWLKEHRYEVNGENQRLSLLRTVVNGVAAGIGLLAVVILASGVALFMLLIELLLARARAQLDLLLQLGYSPALLARFVSRRFVPMALAALGIAFLLLLMLQALASHLLTPLGLYWPAWPGVPVLLAGLLIGVVVLVQLRLRIRRILA